MTMMLHCPQCGGNLSVPPALAGKEARCPSCGKVFLVPQPPPGPVGAAGLVGPRIWIRGEDGSSYGPADEALVRQWIIEGRLTELTPVRDADQEQWTPAGAHPWVGPLLDGAVMLRMSAGRMSRLAIASLLCGIAGLLPCFYSMYGVPSVLGIILGFASFKQIKRTGLGGAGVAIAGVTLGVAGLIILPFASILEHMFKTLINLHL